MNRKGELAVFCTNKQGYFRVQTHQMTKTVDCCRTVDGMTRGDKGGRQS